MERLINRRQQGDLGEASAIEWLTRAGATVFLPFGHSPDVDLVALMDGRALRVEVKTSSYFSRDRWSVSISTRGGNQSWSGVTKYFDPSRCEFLFVHVADGRRWFIPAGTLESRSTLNLGGPKYSEFEIDPGAPFDPGMRPRLVNYDAVPGEYRSGQTGCAVNALAQSFAGSNPASPTVTSGQPIKPTRYERKLGQAGQAVINQKRRLTIPQRPFFEAGLENRAKVRVRADGPGRLVLEQIELPRWAHPLAAVRNDEEPPEGGPSSQAALDRG